MALTDTPALTPPDVEEVRSDARAALDAVTDAARGLDAAGLDAPSALPGWSRSHVLAHVTAIGEAMARQAERAADGELVEVYDGGAAGREDGIRAGALRSGAQHVAALDALADRLDAAWPAAGSAGWAAPVTYRDGTVTDALVAWWREVRIHAVDLDAGVGLDTWPPRSVSTCSTSSGCGSRTTSWSSSPENRESSSWAPAVSVWDRAASVGTGRPPHGCRTRARGRVRAASAPGRSAVVVHGSLTDVAAWLAGRAPTTEPTARLAGEPVRLPRSAPGPLRTPRSRTPPPPR